MATVGDLFVQIRGKTDGLTKALRGARRRLKAFASSGAGMVAGVAAGLGAWKLFDTIMGHLLSSSGEFRESWANLQNTISDIMSELAETLGPILADAVNGMAEWLETSEFAHNAIEGIGIALEEYVIPAIKTAVEWLETGSNMLADWITELTGVNDEMEALAAPVAQSDIDALVAERAARGARGSSGDPLLAGFDTTATSYLRDIRDRVEVPR